MVAPALPPVAIRPPPKPDGVPPPPPGTADPSRSRASPALVVPSPPPLAASVPCRRSPSDLQARRHMPVASRQWTVRCLGMATSLLLVVEPLDYRNSQGRSERPSSAP